MAETPADTIRRAAQLMRQRATAAPTGPWTHAKNAPTTGNGPAYHAVHCPPEPPYTLGGAIADTGPYDRGAAIAEHIAAMHPGVALAIAGAWEHQADDMADWEANESTAGALLPPVVRSNKHGTRHDWTATLAAARTYLGETT